MKDLVTWTPLADSLPPPRFDPRVRPRLSAHARLLESDSGEIAQVDLCAGEERDHPPAEVATLFGSHQLDIPADHREACGRIAPHLDGEKTLEAIASTVGLSFEQLYETFRFLYEAGAVVDAARQPYLRSRSIATSFARVRHSRCVSGGPRRTSIRSFRASAPRVRCSD